MGTKRSNPALKVGLWPLVTFVSVFTLGGLVPTVVESWEGWREVWADRLFAESFLFSLRIALTSAVLSTALGFVLALFVHSLSGWQHALAQVFRIPLILPHLSVAFLVLLAWTPSGVLAGLWHTLGWGDGAQVVSPVLYSGQGWGIVVAYVLKEVPFLMVLVLAALAQLDPRLLVTARNLGAGAVQRFRTILFPHCFGSLQTGFIITFLYSLGAYEIPFLVGESKPSMVSLRVVSALFHRDVAEHPRARAFLVLLFLFCLAILFLYLKSTSRIGAAGRKL